MNTDTKNQLDRRRMLSAAAATLGSLVVPSRAGATEGKAPASARESSAGEVADGISPWIAQAPAGFVPMVAPGLVAQAEAKGDFASMTQPNQLWPRPELGAQLLERALTDLTGAANLVEALRRFIHPADTVAIKVNGISGQVGHTVAVNFEVIEPLVLALIKLGVPADKITVYEQYPTYLMGCRVNVRKWQLPEGVATGTHNNKDHVMPKIAVYQSIQTRYCRFFTDATAVINMTMLKDHSICGFTGALKNITHGNIDNPHHHHDHQASPQIAVLYRHPIVLSRVRLHIVDALKVIYDKGPLDKDPRTRAPHGSLYATTDPVAMDTVGWRVIDRIRQDKGGVTLAQAGREPRYIAQAAELGLGIHDWNAIRLRQAVI